MIADHTQHTFSLVQHLFICEPQSAQSKSRHVGFTILVVMPNLPSRVDAAVALNHEARFITVEVDNVLSKLMLSSKLESEQPTIAQFVPEKCLRVRCRVSDSEPEYSKPPR